MKIKSLDKIKTTDFTSSANQRYSYRGVTLNITYSDGYYSYTCDDHEDICGTHYKNIFDIKSDIKDDVFYKLGK